MKTTILILLISSSAIAQNPLQRFNSFPDKTQHMTTSTAIAIPATIIAWKITNRQGLATLIGFLSTLAVGASKELIYDKAMGRGTPSWRDMAYNTLGAAYGTVSGTMCIGLSKHMREVEEDKFRELNIPLAFVADSLISDTIQITSLKILK